MSRRLTQEIDLDSGIVVKETYRLDEKLHRNPSEGPAVIERDPATGKVSSETYYIKDVKHRVDGPARLVYLSQGDVLMSFFVKGRHRCPKLGPALIEQNLQTGIVKKEQYMLDGRLHRDPSDGPALVKRDWVTGEVSHQAYYRFGKLIPETKRPMATPRRRAPGRTPSP